PPRGALLDRRPHGPERQDRRARLLRRPGAAPPTRPDDPRRLTRDVAPAAEASRSRPRAPQARMSRGWHARPAKLGESRLTSVPRSETEITMRVRSPRILVAGAKAIVLMTGGATALAKSGSDPSDPDPSTRTSERVVVAAPVGLRVVGARSAADCPLPVPLG